MGWVGDTFSRAIGSWGVDKLTTPLITSTRHDVNDDDLATGIDACLNKNGANVPTAAMDWNGENLVDVGALTVDSIGEAAASGGILLVDQVTANEGINWLGSVASGSGTATKSLTPALTSYVQGALFRVLCNGSWVAGNTLNINGLGAKNMQVIDTIQSNNGYNITALDMIGAHVYDFYYNSSLGTFILQNPGGGMVSATPTYGNDGSGSWATANTYNARWILMHPNVLQCHLVYDGTQSSATTNYLTFTLPTGFLGGYDIGHIPCRLSIGATLEIGWWYPVVGSNVARVYRATGAAFPTATTITVHAIGSVMVKRS